MVKRILSATTIVLLLASFSPASAQLFKFKKHKKSEQVSEKKFIDNIEAGVSYPAENSNTKGKGPKPSNIEPQFANNALTNASLPSVEMATSIQLKYSILLNTDVEQVQNLGMFQVIDEWYGTRYVLGGSTKNGIDCSAFTQILYAGSLGITLPRTAREQYKTTRSIEKEELKEGDLIFFNTRGGVSHVGVYLQNNKFVHAATSGGVMISDLSEAYWAKRLLGFGRYEKPLEASTVLVTKP